jgi:DUF1365 family protein
MNSAIYSGSLRHRRMEPKRHDFSYHVLLFYIDLAEVDSLFRIPLLFSHRFPRVIGFDRKDYLAGNDRHPSLDTSVRALILARTGKSHLGPIRMLTQLRFLGFCFNPVTFYYCFDEAGVLKFVVSEITNTPWYERRAYVHEMTDDRKHHRFEFEKDFHVSPFFPMDLHYQWNFSKPEPSNTSDVLSVHMENWTQDRSRKVFDATLILKATPWTAWNLFRRILFYPMLTFKSFIGIYYQAFLLRAKGMHFYSHPDSGGKS